MTSVRIENLTKVFGKTVAVNNVSLDIPDGQLVTLLGSSGCGKSTTLRCIAGLIEPDGGSIFFGDRRINDVPTARRRIGLLFQRLALFPHMRVFDNVAFGLRMQGRPKDEIAKRVKEALDMVQLPGYENRYPRQLSGGQQQRVALARTIVTDPDILLFDEPLSSLDAKLRDELKTEIRRLHKQTGKTTIYVTHDQGEAFAISDKVYVMNEGRLEQEGTPLALYVNPVSPFVAGFIGSNNFVPATVAGSVVADDDHARPGQIRVDALGCTIGCVADDGMKRGDQVLLLIRPEDIMVQPRSETPGENCVSGSITVSTFAGASTYLEVAAGGRTLKVSVYGTARFDYINSVGRDVTLQMRRCSAIPAPQSQGAAL
jgi:ABC-type Fe3+/spermidine/putrescine transport system ATPase subunit